MIVTRVYNVRWSFEPGDHTTRLLLECHELGLAFNLDADLGQTIDQQTLVLVLRKDQRVW